MCLNIFGQFFSGHILEIQNLWL